MVPQSLLSHLFPTQTGLELRLREWILSSMKVGSGSEWRDEWKILIWSGEAQKYLMEIFKIMFSFYMSFPISLIFFCGI